MMQKRRNRPVIRIQEEWFSVDLNSKTGDVLVEVDGEMVPVRFINYRSETKEVTVEIDNRQLVQVSADRCFLPEEVKTDAANH